MASKLSLFLAELKRRKVYRVAVVYVVVGSPIVVGAREVFEGFNFPPVAWQVLALMVVFGFPIALVLAWAYEIRPEEPREAEPTTAPVIGTPETEQRKSIVVLPFDNMSPDPGDAYFSDGLTEEIITHLSHIRSLRVISRNSAMVLKGTQKDTRTIAQELGVQYVLEGSVRKAGNDLRMTAQLIEAENDAHVWAEKYDGVLDNVFDVQEKVSLAIVDALKINLTPEEEQRIGERPTDDVAAYEVYLRAHQDVFRDFSADGLSRAKRNLQDALDVIGPNAHLYAAMGWVHFQYVNWGLMQEDGIALMDEYLSEAFALDPDCPSAHTVRGFLDFIIHHDPQTAVRTFKRALAVNPDEPLALGGLACVYFVSKISPSVATVVDRLARVDPLYWLTRWAKGAVHFYAGDYDMALEPWRRVYEVAPGSEGSQFYYASALMYTGDSTNATGVLERATAAETASGYVKMLKYALDGDTDALGGELTPELRKTTERDPYWSHHVAAMYGMLGEYEEAMRWIEQAANVGFINYPMLAEHDPFLARLRGSPRYEALLERVKPEWESFEV